ncbi:FlgB family protein [Pontivivens nitratireducens]|uniref:Flagellar basal body rod protein FlgB n=1 Tax=Pontivivens nitratireducens TaxID=2758038 RepID=A0A6G7VLE7_9RHOB|nr:FlgB family protein [Pontibrevibacter nitratireducens]QIK40617.1 FlgB family protein [Pontibrevibacter nitratireducens]
MIENNSLLSIAASASRHAAVRQTVIAQNIANADTPGFVAQDVVSFSQVVSGGTDGFDIRHTRAGHMAGSAGIEGRLLIDSSAQGATTPDGNSVSIEDQMVRAADARRQHDLALTLYRKSLDLIRIGLGRG